MWGIFLSKSARGVGTFGSVLPGEKCVGRCFVNTRLLIHPHAASVSGACIGLASLELALLSCSGLDEGLETARRGFQIAADGCVACH